MQPVPRILSGTPITQELLDSIVRAIHELQGHAITGVNYPLTRAGGMLSAMDNVNQALIAVQNDTGGDLELGAVVGLDGPIEDDPTGALLAFQNAELTFSGIAPADPDHVGKFAVLADPIPDGAVGRACVQGVVRVKVVFTTGDEKWADITDASTATLTAAASGSARILWREGTGAGTVWAICLIGLNGSPPVEWGRPYSASNTGSVSTIDLVVTDEEGVDLAPEEHITVYLRNDQSDVNITARAWDQSTILSFVRSVKDSANVAGVLVGENDGGPGPAVAGDSASQSPPSCMTIYRYDHQGRCIGWFYAVYPGPTWTWYSPPEWGCPQPGGTAPYGV